MKRNSPQRKGVNGDYAEKASLCSNSTYLLICISTYLLPSVHPFNIQHSTFNITNLVSTQISAALLS